MGPTLGPSGSCRPQMGPMLGPWTLLSGYYTNMTDQTSSCPGLYFAVAGPPYIIPKNHVCIIKPGPWRIPKTNGQPTNLELLRTQQPGSKCSGNPNIYLLLNIYTPKIVVEINPHHGELLLSNFEFTFTFSVNLNPHTKIRQVTEMFPPVNKGNYCWSQNHNCSVSATAKNKSCDINKIYYRHGYI